MKKVYPIIISLILRSVLMLGQEVNWEEISLPLTGEVSQITYSKSNPNVIYISFINYHYEYSIHKTTDGGQNWQSVSSPPNLNVSTKLVIDPTNSEIIYSHYRNPSSLYKSLDGGETWTEIVTPTSYTIDGFDISLDGYLYGCYDKEILKSIDGGDSWSVIYENNYYYVEEIYCSLNNNDVIYTISGHEILKTIDGGNNWLIAYQFEKYYPIPRMFIDPTDYNIVYVEIDSTLRTLDGFNTTSRFEEIYILDIDSESNIFKSSEFGLFMSANYGDNWEQVSSSGLFSLDLLAINPTDPQVMLANGDATLYGAGLLISGDRGSSWLQNFGEESNDIQDLVISPVDSFIYAINYAGIFRIKILNQNWEWLGDPRLENFIINPFNKNYQAIFDAYREMSLVTTDGGFTWQEKTSIPDPDCDHALMSPFDPPTIFAWDGGSYQLFRTQNMCETWETLSLPQGNIQFVELSANDPSVVFLKDNYSLYISYDIGSNWTPIIFPDNILQIYGGPFIPLNTFNTQYYFGYDTDSYKYSVIKSKDNSETYTINPCTFPESGYSVDDIVFNPSNENEIFGLYSGSLMASGNGGLDWKLLNNPLGVGNSVESIYYYPANYDILFIETEEGWFKGDISSILSVKVNDHLSTLPYQTKLNKNYPNPFNPTTTFGYELPKESKVVLSVFDMSGRLVETIVNQTQPAGYYSVQWNAENSSSGIYLYRIDAGEFSSVRKCLVVK